MRKLALIVLLFIFSGCSSILPGMQNLDVSCIPCKDVPCTVKICPVIIPITVSLLAEHPLPPYIYCISPQDILSIIVWEHPELNLMPQPTAVSSTQSSQAAGQPGYLVNYQGDIYFPLIGYLHVAGKTIDQVRIELTCRLKEYIRNPQVILRISDYRSKKVYVLGEIHKPCLLPLNDQPMSITDALTLTGSFDPNSADPRHVYVIRGHFTRPTIYWLDARTPETLLLAMHFQLQPDDILYVSSAVVTRWNRFLYQLLPTLQTIWYTKAITGSRY